MTHLVSEYIVNRLFATFTILAPTIRLLFSQLADVDWC